jgi:hypothetical protein
MLLITLVLVTSGCTLPNQYHADGPASRPLTSYGISHGMVSVPVVVGTGAATGHPVWGALASCAFFLGHETEETRTWTYFEWGRADSFADVAVPCLTGFALTKLLDVQSWWRFGREKESANPRPPVDMADQP